MKWHPCVWLLASAFLCLLPGSHGGRDTDANTDCDRVVDVAIVGGGLSGTYAAYRLRDSNMTVELLEYNNRLGGRLFTYVPPKMPDVNFEFGPFTFIRDKHSRVERLVDELKLTPVELQVQHDSMKYFLRGEMMTSKQVKSGNVPFRLSAAEKHHQANLARYYLKELTGFQENVLTDDKLLQLKLTDGRPLYQLRIHEALDMVATEEGKELLRALGRYDSYWAENASVSVLFQAMLGHRSQGVGLTLKEGMEKLPELLTAAFLNGRPSKHKVTLNRQLESIRKTSDGEFQLDLKKTLTIDGRTLETTVEDRVCAKKVILAIPQHSLTQLGWEPLKSEKVREALMAVMPVKAGKIFMTFFPATRDTKPWWHGSDQSKPTYALKSDTTFSQMFDKISNLTKRHAFLASYTDMYKTEFLESLNSEGAFYPASDTGAHKATYSLINEIVSHLSEALGVSKRSIDVPDTVITQFWSKYPFGGAWTILKAGYHPDDVKTTIQHPSLTDDVFIVGSDHAHFQSKTWGMESALATVDQVFDKYGLQN